MNNWHLHGRIIGAVFIGLVPAHSIPQHSGAGQLSGHVVDSVGATIRGADVFVHKNAPSGDSLTLAAHTDIHGNFVLVLPEGGYDILVTARGFVAGVETVPIFSEKKRRVEWKLKALGCNFPGVNCDTVQ